MPTDNVIHEATDAAHYDASAKQKAQAKKQWREGVAVSS